MTQVIQIPNPDTDNKQLPTLDIPDTDARKRHVLILTGVRNLSELTRRPPPGLSVDRLYVGGRGEFHKASSNSLWMLSQQVPPDLDISRIFADLEKGELPGDVTASMIHFSVWPCVWGDGDTLWVIDTRAAKPGYLVLGQKAIEEGLILAESKEKGDKVTYRQWLESLNADLIADKADPSTFAGN